MTRSCDCCSRPGAPSVPGNRPGLPEVRHRAGTWSTFLAAMRAGLRAPGGEPGASAARLRTADTSDFSLALLDAWAVTADVLSFYQERIANEGFLGTATELRSIVELGRLVGYQARPGLAATTYLSYEVEANAPPVTIEAGARVASVPAPGEQMQAFETEEAVEARAAWNQLRPRLRRPQVLAEVTTGLELYLKGASTGLRPGDPILLSSGGAPAQAFWIEAVDPQPDDERTRLRLRGPTPRGSKQAAAMGRFLAGLPRAVIRRLERPPASQPRSALEQARSARESFAPTADNRARLLAAISPSVRETLYAAWAGVAVRNPSTLQAWKLEVASAPFGHNAPLRVSSVGEDGLPRFAEWDIRYPTGSPPASPVGEALGKVAKKKGNTPAAADGQDETRRLLLDGEHGVAPGSFVLVRQPGGTDLVLTATGVRQISFAGYGLSGKATALALSGSWYQPVAGQEGRFTPVRESRVWAGSRSLELAEAPVLDDVAGSTLELGSLVEGLQPGKWLIVAGERSDLGTAARPVAGVPGAELAMIAAVEQVLAPRGRTPLPGEGVHTVLRLARPLAYRYRRATVRIHGNVVKASHGESRQETLGSGDASLPGQRFELKQPPLTRVPAPTPSGAASSLRIRVGELWWKEADGFGLLGPDDRRFVARSGEGGATAVLFGDGLHGARPPSGRENIAASYRSGLGRAGNLRPGQLSLPVTRPLGVKGVTNPLRASGGADADGRDQARANAPLAVMALDRLVSIQDHADFSRTFAGVGKAAAVRIVDGGRQVVHVTVAGAGDIPIEPTSDLLRNLGKALRAFGDPAMPVEVAVRERLALLIAARVRIDAERDWTRMEPEIRAALLETFGFERLELGRDLFLSELQAAIQAVPGVAWADVDAFTALGEADLTRGVARPLPVQPRIEVALARRGRAGILPAQIAYLSPDVPDTLLLQEVKP